MFCYCFFRTFAFFQFKLCSFCRLEAQEYFLLQGVGYSTASPLIRRPKRSLRYLLVEYLEQINEQVKFKLLFVSSSKYSFWFSPIKDKLKTLDKANKTNL